MSTALDRLRTLSDSDLAKMRESLGSLRRTYQDTPDDDLRVLIPRGFHSVLWTDWPTRSEDSSVSGADVESEHRRRTAAKALADSIAKESRPDRQHPLMTVYGTMHPTGEQVQDACAKADAGTDGWSWSPISHIQRLDESARFAAMLLRESGGFRLAHAPEPGGEPKWIHPYEVGPGPRLFLWAPMSPNDRLNLLWDSACGNPERARKLADAL